MSKYNNYKVKFYQQLIRKLIYLLYSIRFNITFFIG